MESIIYDNNVIYYTLEKKRNKNLYARLNEENVIVVTAPYLVSKRTIEKFVIESYFKLMKKKEKRKDKVIANDGKIKVLGDLYDVSDIDNLNYLLQMKLKVYITQNYLGICKEMNIDNPPRVVFKRVKGYLGEYNRKTHQISLNILIAHLEPSCIRYVIIHELCHIRYMNHQEAFWREVEKYEPNYRKLRIKCKKEFIYYENY